MMNHLRSRRRNNTRGRPPLLLLLLAVPIVLPSTAAWGLSSLLPRRPASLTFAPPSSALAYRSPTPPVVTPRRSGQGPFETETPPTAGTLSTLIHTHTKLMKALCPGLQSCRMYSPVWERQRASLDDATLLLEEGDFAALLASGKDPNDASVVVTTSCESIPAKTSPSILLLPLHAKEAMDWLVLSFDPATHSTKAEYSLLDNCITCLAAALNLASHQHHQQRENKQARAGLAPFLQAVRTPLGALRTFSKLLLRRLERDPEGLSYELAKNVLIQSDQLVELLLGVPPEVAVGGGGGGGGAIVKAQDGAWEEEEEEEAEAEAGGGLERREGLGRSRSSTLCELRSVLAPVVSAAQLVSSRDGISFFFFQEEGLPMHVPLLDETLFQETLGSLVESALGYALEGAMAGGEKPVVTLDVRRLNGGVEGKGGSTTTTLVFLVQDNGVGARTTRSPAFGSIRKDVERIGARLEIRGSEILGGTQASLYIDCNTRKP